MKEIWKDVDGYEGLYRICNSGKIYSLITYKIISLNNNGNDYFQVHLHKDGFRNVFLIHRLVGIHFVDNPENKPEIDHKDGDRSNNWDWNLRWCTTKENQNFPLCKSNMSRSRIGRFKGNENPNYGNKGYKNPVSKPVIQYTKSGKFIKRHENGFLAAEEIGCHHTNISRCCNNVPKYKSAGGFKWQFESTEQQT